MQPCERVASSAQWACAIWELSQGWTCVQVRMAGASSAFVGERYAVVCEVLDQFGRSFSGDPKCGASA